MELLNQVLLPLLIWWENILIRAKYFLPAADCQCRSKKNSIEVLEPLLQTGNSGEEMPVVVIATVEGDIHDIGKIL